MNVTLNGVSFPENAITFNLSGTGISEGGDVGKVVCLDTTAANTCKLATAGSEILGRILHITDLSAQNQGITCSVETKGGLEVPYTGTLAIGDKVVGAGEGKVRVIGTSETTAPLLWTVASVDATAGTAVIFKF